MSGGSGGSSAPEGAAGGSALPDAAGRRRARYRRWVAFGGLFALLAVGLVTVVVSRTGFGQERLRRATVDWLEDRFPGAITIADLGSEASLFGTMTLGGVTITDPSGRPFVDVERALISYDWRTLVSGRVVFDRVDVRGARLVLERLPGWEEWNYERAFRGETPDPADSSRTLVDLRDVTIADATVEVRLPWEGGDPDSARVLVEDTPSGPVRVYAFQDLSLEADRVLAETPGEPGRLVELDALSADVYVWDQPARVRSVRGTVSVRDSIVSLDLDRVELPGSRLEVAGRVVVGDAGPKPDLRISGDRLDLADFGWLHPNLPREGSGRADVQIRALGPRRVLWFAENLDLETPQTHLRGSLGLVTGDTLYFSRLNLDADPFDIATLERLLPVDLPLDGLEAGTLRLDDGS